MRLGSGSRYFSPSQDAVKAHVVLPCRHGPNQIPGGADAPQAKGPDTGDRERGMLLSERVIRAMPDNLCRTRWPATGCRLVPVAHASALARIPCLRVVRIAGGGAGVVARAPVKAERGLRKQAFPRERGHGKV